MFTLKIQILCYSLILSFSILVINNEENSKLTFIIIFFFAQSKNTELVKSGNEGNLKNCKKKHTKMKKYFLWNISQLCGVVDNYSFRSISTMKFPYNQLSLSLPKELMSQLHLLPPMLLYVQHGVGLLQIPKM